MREDKAIPIAKELGKLLRAKTLIRKAIQTKTDMPTETTLDGYPPYIEGIVGYGEGEVTTTGLLDYCEDGTSVYTLPEDVTTIREYAFHTYTCLEALVLPSTTLVELQGISAFFSTPIFLKQGGIYVPTDLIDKYKTAENWEYFADCIYDIADVPEEKTTNIIEWEETSGAPRTVEWFSNLTLEDIEKDNRSIFYDWRK